MRRRVTSGVVLAAVLIVLGQAHAQTDPLPSWNDGEAQRAIMEGALVPLALAVASGNPIGLIISSAAKVRGEVSGRTTIEGAAKRTAQEIADKLHVACQKQGWI